MTNIRNFNRGGWITLQNAYRLLIVLCMLTPGRVSADLKSRLTPLIEAHQGDVAVAVKHLTTGEQFTHRANEPMPTASLIKFPIMIETYRQAQEGQLDLNKTVTLTAEDKVPGSGILTPNFSPGAQFRLRDAVRLMIAYSDNTATNLVIDQIGLAAVAKTMEHMGFPHTKLHAKVFRGDTSIFPERSRQFGLGSTTAQAMLQLFESLQQGKLISTAACKEMRAHLLACESDTKLPRFLPAGTKIAHKTGSVSAARCDAGIIETKSGPIFVCVLTANNKDRSWTTNNAGDVLCAKIGRTVFDYFNPVKPGVEPKINNRLEIGSDGDLVEALQRTLNARLSPSPDLGIDGDYGPVTAGAVKRFQASAKLPVTGVVDEATWQALGTLITEPEPVPEPEVVNNKELEREPADELEGTPFVTCKSWAIADGRTGRFLWGAEETVPRGFASTTKMMTAYLVLSLAEKDATILEEEVVFSRRADLTRGSTAGVRAGERLPVSELLYGLMLPSGNDASVALAEHFGGRFAPPANASADAPAYDRFIAEMNRTAARLQMTATHYVNPHGLTADGHVSTAADLLKLAWAAMQIPRFRNYVNTRQHGTKLVGAGGYQRNVIWKNTNQLLKIEGYGGVKTGTTSDAGACLVSYGVRGSDSLFLVVLGATSGDARYVDSRNLYRWAWKQRSQP